MVVVLLDITNCNKKNPINSAERLDFNIIQTAIIGRNVPTVGINISGLKGITYFDTAARTSVAGYTLYQKLKEKKAEFQSHRGNCFSRWRSKERGRLFNNCRHINWWSLQKNSTDMSSKCKSKSYIDWHRELAS